jgi:hypothetical protein
VHREFFGTDGAFRVGPPKRRNAGFDELSHRMVAEVDGAELMRTSEETSSSRTAPREGEGDPG